MSNVFINERRVQHAVCLAASGGQAVRPGRHGGKANREPSQAAEMPWSTYARLRCQSLELANRWVGTADWVASHRARSTAAQICSAGSIGAARPVY